MADKSSRTFAETDARIAEGIIKSIDDAVARGVKWKPPFDQTAGFPSNPTTRRAYGGSYNGFILLMMSSQWGDNRWAGFGQWRKAGNTIRKGERGTAIFFPRFKCAKCNKPAGFAKKCGGCGTVFSKRADKVCYGFGESKVFNNLQGSNPLPPVGEIADVDPAVGFEKAAALVAKAGAEVRHGGNRATYSPTGDYITLPEPGAFTDSAAYWATSMHEHAHWTGAASRLNRPGITDFSGFGSESYAYEELVAEISASFLCKHTGVQREGLDDNHAAYLASWRKALSDDPAIIRRAVGEAGKVLRYLTK